MTDGKRLVRMNLQEYRFHFTKYHAPWTDRLSLSHLEGIMGSPHSKPAANKSKRFKKVNIPLNTFLAGDSFGYAVHFDDFMFQSLQIKRCYLCSRRVTVADEIVYHNTERCQAAFHAQCMRHWLRRFIDLRGRHTRLACVKCNHSLNIRQGDGGKTKLNPLDDFKAF